MSITDSLEKRAHVVHYKTDDIPTKDEIERILKIGYPLASSKQNAFPYKVWILGPNAERSEKLYQMTEQNKLVSIQFNNCGIYEPFQRYCKPNNNSRPVRDCSYVGL